jgi:regulator of protease activity HflC (stomatin/prohibitin superfamily)
MFERLIDFFLSLGKDLLPMLVVNEFEEGIVLRFGKYHKSLKAGLHFKIPFVDQVLATTTVTTTMHLNSQSLTTLDGKGIVLRGVVKYKIKDVEKFLLNVYDAKDAIGDVSMGCIKTVVMNKNWADLLSSELDDTITKEVKSECKKWGVDISKVTLTDLAIIKSIRLFNEPPLSDN